MAITYSPNVWRGPHFEEIFSEVIYSNKTVDKNLVRFLTNVKSQIQLTSLTGAPVVQPYSLLAPAPQGNVNFADATLTPVKEQLYDEFDMNQMLNTMFSEDMAAGAANMNSPKYIKAVTAFVLPRVSKSIETFYWKSVYDILSASTANIDRTGAVLTATNVLDEIKAIYAALPGEVLATGEAKIYMPEASKQLLLIANSDRQFRDLLTVSGDDVKYLDCPIEFVPLPANTIIAGRASDFVWGTDLLSDMGSLEIAKVYNNSDLMFMKLVFTQGAAVCVPTQKVLSKPA